MATTTKPRVSRLTAGRIAFAVPGLALLAFGIYRLLTQISNPNLIALLEWLIGAVILHDALLSPSLVGIGWLISRLPGRGRRYVQGALIAGGLVTVVAIPYLYRERALSARITRQKAILDQNFGLNLTTLLAIIVAATLLLYAVRVVRDRRAASTAPASRPRPTPGGAASPVGTDDGPGDHS